MADPIEKFREHHDKIIREKQRGVDVIQQEFLEIGQYSKSLERDEKKFGCKEGRDHQLMNRYRDILPFDSTRVTLRNAPYINASWVNKKEYIATQGPKPDTIRAFWEMVIQYEIKIIVMLCKLKEVNNRLIPPIKEKCAEYWPQEKNIQKHISGSDKMESITVTLTDEDDTGGFVVRQLSVKNRNGIHKVLQFQMLTWPDYGVPTDRDQVLHLIDAIRNRSKTKAPILMHCSAGVGRTGTIIALDLVKQMKAGKNMPKSFSIKNMVKELRKQRMKMVQSIEQYRFLYEMIDYMLFENRERVSKPATTGRRSRPNSASLRKQYGTDPSEMAKAMSLQSPSRNRRSSAKDHRPVSEYAPNRHARANLRKSRSVEKLSNGIDDEKPASAVRPVVPDGSKFKPEFSSRSRRPARRNGMKGHSRENSRDGQLDQKNQNIRKGSESSSDIDFATGPGKCFETTDNSASNSISDSKPRPATKSKDRKEIVKLKETPKSKSSLFSNFFNRTPKKQNEQKNAKKSKYRNKNGDDKKGVANNISANFRQPTPTPPESIADSSRSENSVNTPRPNIMGKMWITPKKNKSSASSPRASRKKGKAKNPPR